MQQPYNSRLIPKSTDSKISESQLNAEDILCRWTNPKFELKDQEGKLNAEAIEERRFFDYSINKIPPSDVQDVYLSFHDEKKFQEEWAEGNEGYLPNDEEYYLDKGNHFLFQVKDIHNYQSTYPFPNEPDAVHNYAFKVKVVHKPLISNIAHFEFDIQFLDINGNEPASKTPGSGSSSRKVITADLRQRLIKKSKFDLGDF